MSEYKPKPPKQAQAVMSAYKKIEDTVAGTYKKIEDTVVGAYKKVETGAVDAHKQVETKFVDAFLDQVDDGGVPPGQSSSGEQG